MNQSSSLFRMFIISACLLVAKNSASQPRNCASVKNGVFHSYPKNSADYIIGSRNGAVQTEVSRVSGDSINFSVTWLDDCSYSLKYQSSSKLKPAILQIFRNNTFITEITAVTESYYVYSVKLNSKKNAVISSDTMWLQQKTAVPDNRIFMQTTPVELRKSRFSDTSQYAVLYVFRTGKVACMAQDYVLEANSLSMFLSKNNTAGIFKIYKPGPLALYAKIGTKEGRFSFNVEHGKTYYLAAYIKWTIPYCSPDIYLLPDDKGKTQKAEAGF